MTYQRDRFLDDSSVWHVSLELRSRSGPMHSLMTSLTPEERAAVSDALASALDAIVPVLRQRLPETRA
jgi:hypothetical protein